MDMPLFPGHTDTLEVTHVRQNTAEPYTLNHPLFVFQAHAPAGGNPGYVTATYNGQTLVAVDGQGGQTSQFQ